MWKQFVSLSLPLKTCLAGIEQSLIQVNFLHYWGITILSTSPNSQSIIRFSSLTGGNPGTINTTMWALGFVPPDSFIDFLSQPWVLLLHAYANQYSAEYSKETLYGSLMFFDRLSPLWSSALWTLSTWPFLDFLLYLLNSGRHQCSAWALLYCITAWKLSPGNNLRWSIIGFIAFSSHLSVIILLHYSMPNVLRTVVSHILTNFLFFFPELG